MRSRLRAIPGLVVSLALASCSAGSNTGGDQGTVIGTIRVAGGPAPGSAQSAPGTVSVFTSPALTGKAVTTAKTDSSGAFTVRLKPGTYYLAATSARFQIDPAPGIPPCRAGGPAVVTTGNTVRVDVICQMK